MGIIPTQSVIENVLQYKMRGKVAYLGHVSASVAVNLTYVKPFDHPSGKGYQRPVDRKRCKDFAAYLSKGDDALFTPILLNADSKWDFVSYDRFRSSYGRLICNGKASVMDGQHRLGGISKYIQETNSDLNVPFLAFHCLDEDEEMRLFDTINTKAKGIGSSLSRFLRRDSDDISWIATELLTHRESPFYSIGTIIGKRNKDRHITLQNLYKTLHYLTNSLTIAALSKEEKLVISLAYYQTIKEQFGMEWGDYKGYRLTHIVCLDALSIAGASIIENVLSVDNKSVDNSLFHKSLRKIKKVDWSVNGPMRFLKGLPGSRSLANDLKNMMLN